jgi:hypothetical protein
MPRKNWKQRDIRTPKGNPLKSQPANHLNLMVSRAGLEPATTALKVRCRFACLLFHAQNTGVWQVRECTGLHRMPALRYQTWCQTANSEQEPPHR